MIRSKIINYAAVMISLHTVSSFRKKVQIKKSDVCVIKLIDLKKKTPPRKPLKTIRRFHNKRFNNFPY